LIILGHFELAGRGFQIQKCIPHVGFDTAAHILHFGAALP